MRENEGKFKKNVGTFAMFTLHKCHFSLIN